MIRIIDTHTHLDGEEFADDRQEVIERAREAGVCKVFIPAIDLPSVTTVMQVCSANPGYAYPMIGLHPEEVRADWQQVLDEMKQLLLANLLSTTQPHAIAIGEVGLDYYWSREFEKELPGGVFHCFTGNEKEAAELLRFDRFLLGIGGVLTFKKSHLPEVIKTIPLERIVLETDSPYMAPVPMRGKRNEPAFTAHVLQKMAEAYGMSSEDVAAQTTANAMQLFLPEEKL